MQNKISGSRHSMWSTTFQRWSLQCTGMLC